MSEGDADPEREGAPQQRSLPGSPGAVLLAERRSQGLSLGDVARQLKLSVRQVEALERDEYGVFSGSVFVRGFLRNYAKLLRLDPDRLLEAAGASIAPAPVVAPEWAQVPMAASTPERRRRIFTWSAFAVLAVVVLLLVASNASREQRQTRIAQRSLAPEASEAPRADSPPPGLTQAPSEPLAGAPAPAAQLGTGSERETGAGANRELAAAQAPAAPGSDDSTSSRMTGSEALRSAEENAPAKPRVLVSGSGSNQIRMIFEDESWVEVRDGSGETILSRLNAPGTERLIRGEPPFLVVVGNAHAVKVLYRGKPIDLGPHTRIDVARVTLE